MIRKLVAPLVAVALAACGHAASKGVATSTADPPDAATATPSEGSGPSADGGTAASDGGAVADGAAPAAGPRSSERAVLYTPGARHSPLTPFVARTLAATRAKVPSRDPHSFIRMGDNLSHRVHLLGCLDDPQAKVDLGATAGAQGTVDWFKKGRVAGVSPFAYERDFENVTPSSAIAIPSGGGPSFLQGEIDKGNPALALVMFGSLDLYHVTTWQPDPKTDFWVVDDFGPYMLALVDQLIAQGTVPLVRSIPPRGDTNMGPWTPLVTLMNAMNRAIAQGRQVPFADLYADAKGLGPEGYWSDGLHLSTSPAGGCVLADPSFAYGDNVMNRIALEQLDRVRRVLFGGEAPPDADGAVLEGAGTAAAPFVATTLPFGDLRAVNGAASARTDYSACGGVTGETASEHVYRVVLTRNTKLRAFAFDGRDGGAKTYVHYFAAGAGGTFEGATCVRSHPSLLELELGAGTHYFVVDGTPGTDAAEYVFGLDPCADSDTACTPP